MSLQFWCCKNRCEQKLQWLVELWMMPVVVGVVVVWGGGGAETPSRSAAVIWCALFVLVSRATSSCSANPWLDYRLDDITWTHPHTVRQQPWADSPISTDRAFKWITHVYPSNGSHHRAHPDYFFGSNPDGINYSSKERSYTRLLVCLTGYNRAVNKTRIRERNCNQWNILHVLIFQLLGAEIVSINHVLLVSGAEETAEKNGLVVAALELAADTWHHRGLSCTKAKSESRTCGSTGGCQRLIVREVSTLSHLSQKTPKRSLFFPSCETINWAHAAKLLILQPPCSFTRCCHGILTLTFYWPCCLFCCFTLLW